MGKNRDIPPPPPKPPGVRNIKDGRNSKKDIFIYGFATGWVLSAIAMALLLEWMDKM